MGRGLRKPPRRGRCCRKAPKGANHYRIRFDLGYVFYRFFIQTDCAYTVASRPEAQPCHPFCSQELMMYPDCTLVFYKPDRI